jgi:hypothetical protein
MSRRARRTVGEVLVRCVRGDDGDASSIALDDLLRSPADLDGLAAAAAFHGIPGFVHRRLQHDPTVPCAVRDDLTATYHRARMTHLQALADLSRIADVLDSLGLPWLTVKGPVLAELVYPRPDLRSYTDLDVVVPRDDLPRALAALETIGARTLDANWDLLARTHSAELHLAVGNTIVDLHWHIFNIGELRQEFPLEMGALFERSRRVQLPGCTAPTLDAADTALHLGVHGCLSGANRLVWLKDMEEATGGDEFPWTDLVERARASGAGGAVASMLLTARRVIGTPVPDDIVAQLAGADAWPRWVAGTARVCRPERTMGRRSPLRLVARSTRRDLPSSAAALARRSWAGAHDVRSGWPDLGPTDPADPNAIDHPAGSRAEFLAAVANEHA